eukprot:GHVR01170610.1.p1 GENE.GHVR01170610.1~~GHVR01170610.1.p1  ORF type:complete len:396 (-),score=66.50 GHVR01170610.1:87-1274(-)
MINRVVQEFVVVVCPTICALLNPLPVAFIATLTTAALIARYGGLPKHTPSDSDTKRPQFISNYRCMMMVVTCIIIFFVDFFAFPRRFAKTTRHHYSLMDAGVGAIIFSSGVVSRQARDCVKGGGRSVVSAAVGVSPLLLIGFVRFFLVWLSDKHVPVDEYGTHWNFFFTISVVSLVSSSLCPKIIKSDDAWKLAAGVSFGFEIVSRVLSLEKYVFEAERTGFFSSNREGILGCIGFTSLYLFGVSLGTHIFKTLHTHTYKKARKKSSYYLLGVGLLCTFIGMFGDFTGLFPSTRRIMNFGCLILTVGVNCLSILIFILCDTISTSNNFSFLMDGIRMNQLIIFLLGNLLTGIVGMLVQTLLLPPLPSILIVIMYCFIWSSVAFFMGVKKYSLKVW